MNDTAKQPGGGNPPALGWLIALRFLLVVVSLAIIVTRQVGRPLATLLLNPPAFVLLACLPLNFIYWVFRHRGPSRRSWVGLQTVVDLGVISLLIYLTGGVASNLRFLYFAPILASSSLFGLAGGVLCASAATISVAVVTLAHFFAFRYHFILPLVSADWRPLFSQPMLRPQLLMLFGQAVSFYLVAALSGTLAVRLRQVRILNEEILERLTEGVLTIDRDGRVVLLNRRAHELLRVPFRQSTTGRPWQDICPQHLIEPLGRMLEQILRRSAPTPTHFDFETEFTPVGLRTPLPTQVVSAPLSDDRGRLRGVTVVFIDLTERKRMESALRQAERLEALNQAAAGIAHEIRNPIASIRASAQELLEHRGLESTGDTPQRQAVRARLLRVLILESDRLNHIVSDFMTYARIRPPADEPIALAEVLEHVVTVLEQQASPAPPTSEQPEAVRRSATGDGYKITCTCPPDLLVVGDREQLVQVFLNLGLNSLQAMPAGGPVRFVAEVEGSAAPAGREPRVVVSVSDDGPGIDRDAIQRIFEPFFTTKTKGTGMGLPVVKRIVEAHGGRVTVESRESAAGGSAGHEGARGAVFRVELPGAVRGRTSRRQRRQQSTGVSP